MDSDRHEEILKRDAYECGAKAYRNGCSCLENPFGHAASLDRARRSHWELGWVEAALDDKAARD